MASNTPGKDMSKRINISVPVNLREKMRLVKGKINFSEICQKSLEHAIELEESRLLLEDKKLAAIYSVRQQSNESPENLMTTDRPSSDDSPDDFPDESPDNPNDRIIRSLEELQQIAEERDREYAGRQQQRDREYAERERQREEEIAEWRSIVADKSLKIDEAQYQRAIELAQILADRRYRDNILWFVTVRRQVGCIATDNDIELIRAAMANTSDIDIRAEFGRCRFSVDEAEAIVRVLLSGEGNQ